MRLFEGTPWDRPPKCERCGLLESECKCPPLPDPPAARKPPEKQRARVQVEKRARGKLVTVVRGLAAVDNDLPELLTHLKNACGAGGTVKDDELEIQGDHRDRVLGLLGKRGYKTS
ncbi:MAG: translation initiation factor [Pirellulales bacterium]